MAEYDRMTVVEMIITVGFGMIAWRDTLNGRVNQIGCQEIWCTLLRGALQQVTQYMCG